MLQRKMLDTVRTGLAEQAAVALLGPRQSGKTTLALALAAEAGAVYLDLESVADRAKLADAADYLGAHEGRLVILDEIQRVPDLFPVLRGLIDSGRRKGLRSGRFLLLGSASMELMRQSGESLAGRIRYLELTPLQIQEVEAKHLDRLWLRGGFPESFLAETERSSLAWREDLIRTYLERDIPQLGPRIPAETLRRFWTMLAHSQGGLHNAARIAAGLEVSGQTVARYTDLLVDLLLVRRLQPYLANVGKRLVKSPKVYIRDSGLLHALLNLGDRDALLGHPVVGGSWEGFVIENLLAAAPARTVAGFYRSTGGAEIDLVLELPGGDRWAIKIKRQSGARPERGFHHACADLHPARSYVVRANSERYKLKNEVEAIGLSELAGELEQLGN
ncbi:MAG: ATP-binding protein [Oceanipulchritudo sp.]